MVDSLINQIVASECDLTELDAKKAKLRAKIRALQAALQKEIMEGASTGDPIRDLTIRFHGYNETCERAYGELLARMKGRRGEFVLVPFTERVCTKHVFVGPGNEYENVHKFRLGVLGGEDLELNDTSPTITVPQFIECKVSMLLEADQLRRPFELVKKNILSGVHSLQIMIQCVEPPMTQRFIIGDTDVRAWLEEKCMPGLWKPAADALSKLILEPTDETD